MSLVERTIEKLRRSTVAATSGGGAPSATRDADAPIGALVGSGGGSSLATDTSGPAGGPARVIVNRDALRAAGYLPETGHDRQFADHYRRIKRPLVAAALASPEVAKQSPRLILMASALPGDGKTFTSINLALSIAQERDVSVVLVDGDVAKPHITRIFGVSSEPGLLDALADDTYDIESCVLATDVRGLSIVPAGTPRDGATELLASARMATLAENLIRRNPSRIVLFDSSPLIVSSESRALASIAGQIVLVVRAGSTPRQAILDALSHLSDARSIGLVLNQGRPSLTEGLYGYGRYGSYGEDAAAE